MNTARIASLLRELADAFEDGTVEAESRGKPKKARRAKATRKPAPEAVSELDRERARKALRGRAFIVSPKQGK